MRVPGTAWEAALEVASGGKLSIFVMALMLRWPCQM